MIATAAEFGRLVRERRIAKGWTQAQLAERCGTGARFIGDLEAGKPTIHLGKALAVVKPGTTEEVAAVVRLCAETRTPIVPPASRSASIAARSRRQKRTS